MADRFDEMARAVLSSRIVRSADGDAEYYLSTSNLAALLRKVHDEAIERAANLVQERKHGVGNCTEEDYNFTREWNDGRVFAYQDAEDRIRALKAGGK